MSFVPLLPLQAINTYLEDTKESAKPLSNYDMLTTQNV